MNPMAVPAWTLGYLALALIFLVAALDSKMAMRRRGMPEHRLGVVLVCAALWLPVLCLAILCVVLDAAAVLWRR